MEIVTVEALIIDIGHQFSDRQANFIYYGRVFLIRPGCTVNPIRVVLTNTITIDNRISLTSLRRIFNTVICRYFSEKIT